MIDKGLMLSRQEANTRNRLETGGFFVLMFSDFKSENPTPCKVRHLLH